MENFVDILLYLTYTNDEISRKTSKKIDFISTHAQKNIVIAELIVYESFFCAKNKATEINSNAEISIKFFAKFQYI